MRGYEWVLWASCQGRSCPTGYYYRTEEEAKAAAASMDSRRVKYTACKSSASRRSA